MYKTLLPLSVSLNFFCEFAKSADKNTFITIFGKRLGEHFWDKHINSQDGNMTWTYNDMDNDNRNKLAEWIYKKKV